MTDYFWWVHEKMFKKKRDEAEKEAAQQKEQTGEIHVKEEHVSTTVLDKLFDKFKR